MRSRLRTLKEVIRFASEQTSFPESKIRGSTRLAEDLGLDGDDADEFMGEFAKRFDVDLGNLDYSRHFGPEAGATPFSCIAWLLHFRGLSSITIERLAQAADNGKW